ncbi:MAG: DsbA family oxidoreductase [Phaeodactylibacter sp.]|nr:DsbA family oxidoreductase [Phaeodactylibacter sp.]
MSDERVKIEIWSDVVCPFCFIGKKKIEQAIAQLGVHDQVEVIWHSYQLDPTFPKDTSMLYYPYHYQRSGYTEAQLKPTGKRLNQIGLQYGIEYKFEHVNVVNSLNLHRLLFWSKEFGLYNQLNERLMIAYFSEGADLSNQDELLEIISRVGLDVIEAKRILESDEYLEVVTAELDKSRKLGINGVPFFLIDGTEKISGAQDNHVFENAISNAVQKLAIPKKEDPGLMCSPNSNCKID